MISPQLSSALTNASKVKSKQREEKMNKLSKLFCSFEATHESSADLKKYTLLLTISPTSVNSERACSIAGNFLKRTRKKARIKDGTVDNLCFLQSYFANNSKEKNSK